MVSIGRVWDRTTQVLGGRGSTMAGIAALTILLPTIVRAGYAAYVPQTPAARGIGSLIAILVLLATIWGQLAIVALSSDPANTRGSATAIATRRLPLAIGIIFVIGIVGTLLIVPAFVAIAPALNPMSIRLMQAGIMPNVAPGAMLFVSLYLLVLGIAFLAAIAGAIVTTALSVVATVFATQLYVTVTDAASPA